MSTAVAGVAMLALMTGCQDAPACTLIGAGSEVSFGEVSNAFPDGLQYQVRACVGDECVDWLGDRDSILPVIVPLNSVTGPTTVTARLTLTSATDPTDVVFDASTSLGLVMFQPNGPGCEPTVYQGRVAVTTTGGLVPVVVAEPDPA